MNMTDDYQTPSSHHEEIMDAIRDQHVAIRPRRYFRTRFWLIVGSVVIGLLMAFGHAGMFFALLHRNGHDVSDLFSSDARVSFLAGVPWMFLLPGWAVALALLLIAWRRTGAYRWPFVTVFILAFLLIGVVGYLLSYLA